MRARYHEHGVGMLAGVCVTLFAGIFLGAADSGTRGRMPGTPVGTLCAFVGGQEPSGWLLCNGRTFPQQGKYGSLYRAIGNTWCRTDEERKVLEEKKEFRIPDLRGMFLRGSGQHPSYPYEGNGMDAVGSYQNYATASPKKKPFAASLHPGLSVHASLPKKEDYWQGDGCVGWIYGRQWEKDDAKKCVYAPGGTEEHEHSVTGGDDETRPNNAVVNWIIKCE